MEFSEIGKELGGLTADQVFELAKFGKDILSHTGIIGLSSGMQNLIKDIINAEDWIFDENRSVIENLLHISVIADKLNEKCWGERKTPFGLTGLRTDNDYLGLKETTDIQALQDMETIEKTDREMTHEEKRVNILKELYGHNLAERITNMPISENTRAALYFKGKVQDVLETLFSLHRLMYTETDDETAKGFCEACRKLDEIADEYITNSINDNIGSRNVSEI